MTVVEFDAMFLNSGNVCEEFIVDDHYVAHVAIDCYEDNIVLICVGDEEHPIVTWLVKAL